MTTTKARRTDAKPIPRSRTSPVRKAKVQLWVSKLTPEERAELVRKQRAALDELQGLWEEKDDSFFELEEK